MGISFNPKEVLASIADSCLVAFLEAKGISQEHATIMGAIAEGTIKGFGFNKAPSPTISILEDSIKRSIHQTMQSSELEHLPEDIEDTIFENAFSIESIKKYSTDVNPIEELEEKLKDAFETSEKYDVSTLPIDAIAIKLIKNIDTEIQNNHELTALSTFYTVNRINAVLENQYPHISKFEQAILNMKPTSEYAPPNPLHYLNRNIGFYGRDQEFEWLDKFCNSVQNVQYAFVQGCSGAGKSRLLYEYINRHNDDNWKLCFLNDTLIKSLMSFDSYAYSKNLLVAIDYAGRYSEIIGKWILKLTETNNLANKIRIVLIERQGTAVNINSDYYASWLRIFYGNTYQNRVLKSVEYGWLPISQLDSSQLFRIMDDYAIKVLKKEPLSNDVKKQIIEYVSTGLKIEPSRQTPLFILLATDAYLCMGSANNWNIDLLAGNYVDRMLEYWRESLCKNNESLYYSLIRVVVFATAVGGINLNGAIPTFIADDLNKIINTEEYCAIFENSSGLNNEIILPIQPDYIGEFFVLQYISNLFPNRNRHAFFDALYCNPMEFMSFFVRCIDDFAHSNRFKSMFNDITNLLKPTSKSVINYVAYAFIIADYAMSSSQLEMRKCAEALGAVFENVAIQNSKYSDFIGLLYSETLSNMTCFDGYNASANIEVPKSSNWSLSTARDSVKKLCNLYDNFFNKTPSLLLPFAKALANSSIYDTSVEARKCADELCNLYETYCDVEPRISILFAMALNNVVCKISYSRDISQAGYAEDALSKLSELYDRHVANADNYNGVIINVINLISNTELQKTVNDEMKILGAKMNMRQIDVAVEYAKALNNIVGLYAVSFNNKAFEYFASLENLYNLHKDEDIRITVEYAKGIVAFIVICTKEQVKQKLCFLHDLCCKHQDNRGIFDILIIRYVKAICNRLAIVAQNNENDEDVDLVFTEIVNLYNRYAEYYAKLPIYYLNSIYYMFHIKLQKNCIAECKSLLNIINDLRKSTDDNVASNAEKYFDACINSLS